MKDIQGILRGKCNSCTDCKEYKAPSSTDRLRCEYCNHTPVEHMRIVELGECTKCDEDNCDAYESDDLNSYAECQYCGCEAKHHKGYEKLQELLQSSDQSARGIGMDTPFPGASLIPGMSEPSTDAGIRPRKDKQGAPLQTSIYGMCNFRGCPYPKCMEGGQIHNFCSKTCAKKYDAMQASLQQEKLAALKETVSAQQQRRPGGGYPSMSSSGSTGMSLMMPGSCQRQKPVASMCAKCQIKPANPGRKWCEQCFRKESMFTMHKST